MIAICHRRTGTTCRPRPISTSRCRTIRSPTTCSPGTITTTCRTRIRSSRSRRPDLEDVGAPTAAAPTYDSDEGWGWHDAAIIAVGRVLPDGETEQYSIGAVDLYANANTGDLGGSYLEIGTFDDIDEAAAYYHELQGEIHDQGLLPFQMVDFATERAAERAAERGEPAPQWRAAGEVEYAAYEEMQSLDAPDAPDLPPDDLDLDAIFADAEPAREVANPLTRPPSRRCARSASPPMASTRKPIRRPSSTRRPGQRTGSACSSRTRATRTTP